MGTLPTGKHSRRGGVGVRDTPDEFPAHAIRTFLGEKRWIRFAISAGHSGRANPRNLVGIDRTRPDRRSPREPRQKLRNGAGKNPLGIEENRRSRASCREALEANILGYRP